MFAQLKKKIEDKENANIPHVVVSPNSISTLRDQSELEGPTPQETPIKTKATDDGIAKSEQLDQRKTHNDGISNHNLEDQIRKEIIIQHLQKDKLELENKLQETMTQLNRVLQSRENTEELESFQTQELAKIKHLLLRSQQELSQKEEMIQKRNVDVEVANQKLSSLEVEVKRLHQEFDTNKMINLQLEKKSLEDEIDRLKQEALRNSSILEVKEQSITQLQERVQVLEKRLNDTVLTGDEMTNAVLEERTSLEKKLEESHQQLNEIKTSWSEKIHNLETQIFHLNKKMAEDSEESSQREKEQTELGGRFREQQERMWTLEEKLKTKQDELEEIKSSITKLEGSLKEKELTSKSKMDHLQNQMLELVKEHKKEMQDEQAKIAKLVAAQSEHIEKDIEVERHITEMEDENRRNKSELTKKGKECHSLRDKLTDLEIQLQNLQQEKRCAEDELDQKQKSLHSLTEECDRLMMRNAELSHDLELLKRETAEEGSNSENINLQLRQEVELTRRKIDELEGKLANNGESNSHVVELKIALANYETELADKNKAIKLQQQRLADMKKALQKELKAQNDNMLVDLKPNQSKEQPTHIREDDINFKYLKHVIFKFMTCSEYEGQHLLKAICALLHFSPDEEQLIKDTFDWKSSWFGLKPHPPRPS